ncbi:hypothetical protein HAX54_031078 [Datura stramonium]|uniref:Putative plant transposon protein domain-containing protein n=1 Tax=Datura stramonium TaxID=4076 RepID=A0ABS8SBW7_DATST|nr:hypothetical protein [Datura stramonium]
MSTSNAWVRFRLDRMEEYYVSFKEKRSIHVEAQFEVPIAPEAIHSLYWTEPIQLHSTSHKKVEDKANQFQWVANIIEIGQPQWAISNGLIHRRDLKFEARMWLDLVCARLIPSQNKTEVPIEVSILMSCIMDHVHINVGELTVEQFKQRDKQQGTSLSYPSHLSMLYVRAAIPLFKPLDKTVRAENVITLATKTDKDSPAMKPTKSIENRTPPPPLASSNTLVA